MRFLQSSDYRIYFDNVRVDRYIKKWMGGTGLNMQDARANITFYRSPELEQWKAYLTQVRIFVLNAFSGKFEIIFEGEIVSRQGSESRGNVGELTYSCAGFYHWLQMPIPLAIDNQEGITELNRYKYLANNIDVDKVLEVIQTEAEQNFRGEYIQGIVDGLFEGIYDGYKLSDDSSYAWARLEERTKVMGDIIKEFTESGYLDLFTFTRNTQIETFYVFLNNVLTQMMFEFYQDRDGAIRIKPPFWGDQILKSHVFDSAVVQSISEFNNWDEEPSRVLVIGGNDDLSTKGVSMRDGAGNAMNVLQVPMALYIGDEKSGKFFSQAYEVLLAQTGLDGGAGGGAGGAGGGFGTGGGKFHYDLSQYKTTSPYGRRDHPVTGQPGKMHEGQDFSMHFEPLTSQGINGEVIRANRTPHRTAGRVIAIKQMYEGTPYIFRYLHLSEIHVNVGDQVQSGQQIGVTGKSGRGTGPHLHWEIRKDKEYGESFEPVTKAMELKKIANNASTSGGVGSGDTGGSGNAGIGSQYDDLINKAAEKHGVNPFLIASIIKQESNFDTNARSHAGAEGLMQLMPGTARGLGVDDPTDPAQSIEGGTKYIADMLRGQGGDPILALAAYNAGPGNVQEYGGVPPFKETEKYVKIIPENFKEYTGESLTSNNSGWNGQTFSGGSGSSSNGASDPNAMMAGYGIVPPTSITLIEESIYGMDFTTAGFENIADSITGANDDVRQSQDMKPVDYFESIIPQAALAPQHSIFYDTNDYIDGQINNSNVSFDPSNVSPVGVDIIEVAQKYDNLSPDLLASIAENTSNFREKWEAHKHYGVMGLSQNTVDGAISNGDNGVDPSADRNTVAFDRRWNIEVAANSLSNLIDRFGKVTFALAAYWKGDATIVEQAINDTADFSVVRASEEFNDGDKDFVDQVISDLTQMYNGHYLKGDPNQDVFVEGEEQDVAEDTEPQDYSASYEPMMSEAERKFKVNLRISQKEIINYSVPDETESGEELNVDDVVQRMAKYEMQVYRAQAHGITVNMSTCLPFVRPGLNAWLEPSRRDLVFYITSVRHQGSFGQGATSSISGAYVRSSTDYDEMPENVFLGETNAAARDFGPVVPKSEMAKLKQRLKNLSTETMVSDPRTIPVLSELYSSTDEEGGKDYLWLWRHGMTSDHIENEMNKMYEDAPPIVKDRAKTIERVFENTGEFLENLLIENTY